MSFDPSQKHRTATGLVAQFRSLWRSADTPPDVFSFLAQHENESPETRAEVLLVDQYHRSRHGLDIRSESYFERCSFLTDEMKFELVAEELGYLEEQSGFDAPAFLDRFRNLLPPDLFADLERELSVERPASSLHVGPKPSPQIPHPEPGESLGR